MSGMPAHWSAEADRALLVAIIFSNQGISLHNIHDANWPSISASMESLGVYGTPESARERWYNVLRNLALYGEVHRSILPQAPFMGPRTTFPRFDGGGMSYSGSNIVDDSRGLNMYPSSNIIGVSVEHAAPYRSEAEQPEHRPSVQTCIPLTQALQSCITTAQSGPPAGQQQEDRPAQRTAENSEAQVPLAPSPLFEPAPLPRKRSSRPWESDDEPTHEIQDALEDRGPRL